MDARAGLLGGPTLPSHVPRPRCVASSVPRPSQQEPRARAAGSSAGSQQGKQAVWLPPAQTLSHLFRGGTSSPRAVPCPVGSANPNLFLFCNSWSWCTATYSKWCRDGGGAAQLAPLPSALTSARNDAGCRSCCAHALSLQARSELEFLFYIFSFQVPFPARALPSPCC